MKLRHFKMLEGKMERPYIALILNRQEAAALASDICKQLAVDGGGLDFDKIVEILEDGKERTKYFTAVVKEDEESP